MGDIFAVPLLDGILGCGHTYVFDGELRAVFFAERASSPEKLLPIVGDMASCVPIFALNVTSDMIEDREWPVLATSEFRHDVELEASRKSHTATTARTWLFAYHGMWPWDGMHDRRYFEKLMVAGAPLPATRRTRAAFEQISPGAYRERHEAHVPTVGAALLTMTIIPAMAITYIGAVVGKGP